MITTTSLMVIFLSSPYFNNPFKISLSLMSLGILTFVLIHDLSGTSMFPLLLAMMFVGGVALIFMVVASLFPNEKMSSKKYLLSISVILVFMLTPMSVSFTSFSLSDISSFFLQGINFYATIFLILLYFFSFIYSISSDKMSLRSNLCFFKMFL